MIFSYVPPVNKIFTIEVLILCQLISR